MQKSAQINTTNFSGELIILLNWFSLLPVTELTVHKAAPYRYLLKFMLSEGRIKCFDRPINRSHCPWPLPSSVPVKYAQVIVRQLRLSLTFFELPFSFVAKSTAMEEENAPKAFT